jgi:hypothetical protein
MAVFALLLVLSSLLSTIFLLKQKPKIKNDEFAARRKLSNSFLGKIFLAFCMGKKKRSKFLKAEANFRG